MAPVSAPRPSLLLLDSPAGESAWSALQALVRTRGPTSRANVVAALNGTPTSGLNVQQFHDEETSAFVLESTALPVDRKRYGVVERGGVVELVSLPVPWKRLDRASNDTEARVSIAAPTDSSERATVTIHDEQLGGLLGFIAMGRLPFAEAFGKEGTSAHQHMLMALHGKVTNPFAAAVGAYLLLQTDSRPHAYWHNWVENLAKWYPWLPDGAVLLGALRLRFASTDLDVNLAREAFETAWARGIPVLAPVLRLFMDGVTTLVDDPEVDAGPLGASLPSIRAVASAMATNQAFTALKLGAS